MARNLVAMGLPTTVWDRSRDVTERLAALGAVAAPSPDEAVREARATRHGEHRGRPRRAQGPSAGPGLP